MHVLQRSYSRQGVRGAQPPGIAGGPGAQYCRGSQGRSPPELQGVWGAQPPSKAGGFGGPPGAPTLNFFPSRRAARFNTVRNSN